jgi:RimJ/RimL family protein N-acetyltransferase
MIFATARLEFSNLSLDDLDFVAEMLAHPEVMRFYPKRYSRAESSEWIERQCDRYARDGHGLWLVREARSGAAVGQVGLTLQDVNGVVEPEVGYLLHRPFWGRGFATEAAAGVCRHAFDRLDLPRVVSLIRPENLPSQRVAERVGMQPEGRAPHAGLDHRVYALARGSTRMLRRAKRQPSSLRRYSST